MLKICVLYCPVWSYASIPSLSRRMMWYGAPAGQGRRGHAWTQLLAWPKGCGFREQ